MNLIEKVIIVEGKTDKQKVEKVLLEPVDIRCTYGTIGREYLQELVEEIESLDVYILVDNDYSGDQLRKQLIRELPNATILEVPNIYKEVAMTSTDEIRKLLKEAHFMVKE
ncbi:toprim domain-containing protein [Massilibacterium senegalense]|uniref:hypothetical protein n=1 Tax=Massilibacterium senegalense TaxID=1632858 RepID=UPI0007837799|nr:hypothetical protein [Massilibacterium senegalense]